MGHTRQSLSKDFSALGFKDGDIVMVHASVRAVGKVYGGPDEIHLAIQDAIGPPAGTMMMVAGCPEGVDDVGRGVLSPDGEAEVLDKQPAFDAKTARANRDLGTLAEFFRSYPGTQPNRFFRSAHNLGTWYKGKSAGGVLLETPP